MGMVCRTVDNGLVIQLTEKTIGGLLIVCLPTYHILGGRGTGCVEESQQTALPCAHFSLMCLVLSVMRCA